MSAERNGRDGQWPGPPPAAERKATEVKENLPDQDLADGAPAAAPESPERAGAALLEPAHTEEFRRRWDGIKASFVDDPRQAVRRAEELADEVVTELTQAVDARRRDLVERREGTEGQDDKTQTERLRVVLNGYQNVLDPVLKF